MTTARLSESYDSSLREESIAWSRMPEPQGDGYDLEVALALGAHEGKVDLEPVSGDERVFDGRVAVVSEGDEAMRGYEPASPTHPSIRPAVELIRAWPAIYRECARLLRAIHVFKAPEGAISSRHMGEFGHIFVTICHPVDLAELIVHEAMHQKLFLLGVYIGNADRLITNSPYELFPSSLRLDRLRPMPAIFHAQYVLTHLVELHTRIATVPSVDEASRHRAAQSLAKAVPRARYGMNVIASATLDAAGQEFMAAYGQWYSRALATALATLAAYGVQPDAFRHPLDVALNSSDRPIRRSDALSRRVLDETMVTVAEPRIALSLNDSATAIWELCDGVNTVDDITRAVSERIGLSGPAVVAAIGSDVSRTVARLCQSGIVKLHRGDHIGGRD